MDDSTRAPLDPVTYEVIRHRLWSINDEAAITMIHVSGSPVVHATDFNFAMYTADGDMATVGTYYMIPVGTMSLMVKEIIATFGANDDIEEGDAFFCNDPFIAAAHQNDVQVMTPFFYKGDLAGWTGGSAHQLDVGGMEPGSWCPKATDVYQEGLRVPPIKLNRAGKRQNDVWTILTSASRLPLMLEMDLNAMMAANTVAHQRLTDLTDRYGREDVRVAMDMAIDQSEQVIRQALRELPDGEFFHTDYLDHDGHNNEIYPIMCHLTKRRDELIFDFTGSAPQTPGFVNSTRPATLGAVASGLFALLGPDAPSWNAGVLAPTTIILPEASIVHASPPAPVSASSVAASWIASHCVVATLSKLIATSPRTASESTASTDGSWPLLNIGGINQYGEPFGDMFMDPIGWGGGAYSDRDGIDTGGAFIAPTAQIIDVESKETTVPVLYLWRRERPDTGGPGRNRGGVTLEFAVTLYGDNTVFSTLATHGVAQPNCAGLFGGYPGSGSGYELVQNSNIFECYARGDIPSVVSDLSGDVVPLEAKTSMFQLHNGDVLNVLPQGGGGFGDPVSRDPEAVATDIRDRRVTPGAAATVYGVVLGGDSGVDVDATVKRRAEICADRLERAEPGTPVEQASKDAPVLFSNGDALEVAGDADNAFFRCRKCRTSLGHKGQSWKDRASSLDLNAEEVGGHITLDPRMAITQYLCPGCGASLEVDVRRTGDAVRISGIFN